jgi:ribosome-associated heat shock protein Hsp15
MTDAEVKDPPRLDKWLWAARFYKTRSLASEAIAKGRVLVNGQAAKPSRSVRVGDRIELQQGPVRRAVEVLALSHIRGPATVAQQLYAETPDSIAARERSAEQRRLAPEPSSTIDQGRPTKRDRRRIADWQRWSVSIDPER